MKMNNKGFTLIELLAVIAVLGILVILAAPQFMDVTDEADVTAVQSDVRALDDAVYQEYVQNPDVDDINDEEEHGADGDEYLIDLAYENGVRSTAYEVDKYDINEDGEVVATDEFGFVDDGDEKNLEDLEDYMEDLDD